MSLAEGSKAELTARYWKASLAWKNIGSWARGWTKESFIEELRFLCTDLGRVGSRADSLLDDMIYDIERRPLETPGVVVPLSIKTQNLGQQSSTAQQTG